MFLAEVEHICPVLAVCFFKSVWFQLFSRMHLLRYPQDLGNQCVEKGCGKGWTEAARAHVVFKSVQKCVVAASGLHRMS